MKITKLETVEQFKELKRGDVIIVEWTDFFVKHHQAFGGCTKIMSYKVVENKTDKNYDEIILRTKGNHFFNYMMYLGLDTPGINTSKALDIRLAEVDDESK